LSTIESLKLGAYFANCSISPFECHVHLDVAIAVVDLLDPLRKREGEILLARQLEECGLGIDTRQDHIGGDLFAAAKLDADCLAIFDEESLGDLPVQAWCLR